MGHQLSNENISLEIDLPKENYQGTRFDWTGKISRVIYKGIPVSGSERKDPPASQWGQAFYNEFGIQEAVGFQEIPIGGWFHKIGVGLLRKSEEEYFFHKDHEIKACNFKTQLGDQELGIQCEGPLTNGYAYKLLKTISLQASGFSLSYHLKNTGKKAISTNEYCHNFLAIDDQDLGEDYQLLFPFSLDQDNFDEVVNPEGKVKFEGDKVGWTGRPKEQFFFSNLTGGKSVPAQWELVHKQTKIGIRETCDFDTNKINLWGWRHVVSPELFLPIFIKPGQTQQWTRNYQIFEL